MTYFCSIVSQILYIFETHGIGQTPSSLERYLVQNEIEYQTYISDFSYCFKLTELCRFVAYLSYEPRISPIWGEAPGNDNATKFCMWVPFSDIIICAKFYRYSPNSFWGTDPRKLVFRLT